MITQQQDVHLRLYTALLRLYPRDFRLEYGQEMLRFFDDHHRDARRDGTIGLVNLWLREGTDLIVNALLARSGQVTAFFSQTQTYTRLAAVFCVLMGALCGLNAILERDDTIVNGSDPIIESAWWLMLLAVLLAMIGLYLRRNTQPSRLEHAGYATGLIGTSGVLVGFGLSMLNESFWHLGTVGFITMMIGFVVIGFGQGSSQTPNLIPVMTGALGLLSMMLSPGHYVPWWGTLPPLLNAANNTCALLWAISWLMLGRQLWSDRTAQGHVIRNAT